MRSQWVRVRNRARRDLQSVAASSESRRELVRNYAHGGLRQVVPYIGTESTDGSVFISHTEDKTIGRHLFSRGEWHLDELPQALARAKLDIANKWFIEVGANIGTTTVQAAKMGARVIAFEPEPMNYRLLRANLVMNGVDDRVITVQAGCSAESKTAFMTLSKGNHGDHRVSESGEVEVRLVALDEHLDSLQITASEVAFLWIDVQGHEPEVLRGAKSLLAAKPPMIMEFTPSLIAEHLADVATDLRHYSTLINMADGSQVDTLDSLAASLGKRWADVLALP